MEFRFCLLHPVQCILNLFLILISVNTKRDIKGMEGAKQNRGETYLSHGAPFMRRMMFLKTYTLKNKIPNFKDPHSSSVFLYLLYYNSIKKSEQNP